MNTLYKERFKKVIDFLKVLPKEQFNIDSWVSKSEYDIIKRKTCGTVCCAAGWLPKIDPKNWTWYWILDRYIPRLKNTDYCFHTSYNDLEKYFNIDRKTLIYIFIKDSYKFCEENPTPKQVAYRIHRFINRKEFK